MATSPTLAATSNVESIISSNSTVTSKAPLASPTFTGTPTAPTPSAGDNSTNIANTAWVQASTVITLPAPSGDTTGVTDSSAFNTALTKLGGASAGTGLILLRATPAGSAYYFSANTAITSAGIKVRGMGAGLTLVYQVGSTPVLSVHVASFYPIGTNNNAVAGRCGAMTIDGTHAGNAWAVDWGNTTFSGYDDLTVQNFTGTYGGIHMNNTVYAAFTEQNLFEANIVNCTSGILFDLGSGSASPNTSSSFSRNRMFFSFLQNANQNGVTVSNGAGIKGGSLKLSGNFNAGASNTGYVFGLVGTSNNNDGVTYSTVGDYCYFDIDIEMDGSSGKTVGHQTIYFDSTEVNVNHSINNTQGTIKFEAYAGASITASNLTQYTNGFIGHIGIVLGDSVLQGWPYPYSSALTYGVAGQQISSRGGQGTLVSGYVLYSVAPTGGNPQVTVAVGATSGILQYLGTTITAATETLTTGVRIPFSVIVPSNWYLGIYDTATGSHGTATIYALQSTVQ